MIADTLLYMLFWFNEAFALWMRSDWLLALAIAIIVHCAIYLIGGACGLLLTEKIWPAFTLGKPLDRHPPAAGQIGREIRNGLLACLIFGCVSLSYRALCQGLWPANTGVALLQLVAFVVFNNLYAYATHRLLHTAPLRRFHGVHHRSVRVTPFSGYSVHPLEACIMAATLPVFMLIVPLGVGTAFTLHAIGMVYTTCIHCNYDLMPKLSDQHWLKKLINHPTYHRYHHTLGTVNFGFTNRLMDILFKTNKN